MVMAGGDKIPVEELDENMVTLYVEEMKLKCEEVLIPYKKLCKSRKVIFFSTLDIVIILCSSVGNQSTYQVTKLHSTDNVKWQPTITG